MSQQVVSIFSWTGFWVVALAGSAFLVLYWALRGAPIGQATEHEGEEAPRASYRDRVIAAVVVGLLLIVTGAFVALTRSIPWSLPLFGLGFGSVLTLIARNRRYRHASPALRRTVEFSDAALTATLLAGVLIVANVLAFRYGGRALDFTRERAFSLSTLTLNQLRSLTRPVRFTLFFDHGGRAAIQADRVRQLLDLYKAANPKLITIDSVERDREFERFEPIAKRVPEVAVAQGGGVLIELGMGEDPSRVVVRNIDLFDIPRGGRFEGDTERFESNFHGEDAVTSALIALREETRPKVVFITGHGEPSTNDVDPRRPGLGIWRARLAATGSEVVELNLLRDEIPTDASLVIVDGPKTAFKPDEAAKLRAYADRGPLLLLLGNQEKSGLDELLKLFNVALSGGLVLDPRLSVRGRPQVVYVPIVGEIRHPIVDSLANRAVLVPSSAPIHLLTAGGSAQANPKIVATPLLKTSKQSWAETELTNPRIALDRGKDEPGPLTVAVAAFDRPKPGAVAEPRPRLVLISSGLFAENMSLEIEPTNQDLLMNAISWLRGRNDLKGIAPKTHVALTLAADPVLRFRLIMVPTVMAILLILGLGFSTYLARRE